eukprot:1433878-Karenia_brevis.AAC.1
MELPRFIIKGQEIIRDNWIPQGKIHGLVLSSQFFIFASQSAQWRGYAPDSRGIAPWALPTTLPDGLYFA